MIMHVMYEDTTGSYLGQQKKEGARHKVIRNKLVQKIIRGRVFIKGHLKR